MPRKRKKRSRTTVKRFRWLRISGIVFAAFVILSLSLVLPFRWIDPPTTAFMLRDQSGMDPVRYEWQNWSDIGVTASLAVVAAEDQKFVQHFGFDLTSIESAIVDFGDGRPLRGASTISQQVAKNLYLWPGRNFLRKGIEAWLTVIIEATWPKRRILEIYLNVAEFGPGIYGVPAASRHYFDREAAQLSDAQAALLAAVLPNPAIYHVQNPSSYVRERQRWIQNHMRRLRREQWIMLVR